eukprot:TRINITY_DN2289_c0_g1_i10.p1 TRINITY_DN2289_c0_g1~~TRINITY_DN2289_c0_g1_i10.p1  ORF type:complete len:340 (+),score=60.20 TRINITY_DN2289_c0_g1_i10:633-1652(+)
MQKKAAKLEREIKLPAPCADSDSALPVTAQCRMCFQPVLHAKTGFAACGHSFCQKCLVEHVADGNETCPQCNKQLAIERTEAAVAMLPDHRFHEALLVEEEQTSAPAPDQTNVAMLLCSIDDCGEEASCICQHCGPDRKAFCRPCGKYHLTRRANAGHELVPLVAKDNNDKCKANTNEHVRCSLHDQKAVLYCTVCKELVCSDCLMQPCHKGHSVVPINTASVLDDLNVLLNELGACQVAVGQRLNQQRIKAAALERAFDNVRDDLKKQEAECREAKNKQLKLFSADINSLEIVLLTIERGVPEARKMIEADKLAHALQLRPLLAHTLSVALPQETKQK